MSVSFLHFVPSLLHAHSFHSNGQSFDLGLQIPLAILKHPKHLKSLSLFHQPHPWRQILPLELFRYLCFLLFFLSSEILDAIIELLSRITYYLGIFP